MSRRSTTTLWQRGGNFFGHTESVRALVVVLALAACTQSQARKAHRVGEIATAAGLVGILASATVAAALPADEDTLTTIGLGFVPVAVIGALVYIATDSRANDAPARPLTPRERRQNAAWDLTKRAAAAARGADCTQVQAISPRVRDLDLEFHATVFMRDVAIQRCLRAN
jgi:hypothetical protein